MASLAIVLVICQNHRQWEAYPATAMAWQEEWAPSSSQIDEQAQLLWALSDRSVPRYRKPPSAQPKSPKSTAITPKRAEREVRFALSPEERASPHSAATMAKTAVSLPRKETQKEQESCPRETPSDEHQPPARLQKMPSAVRLACQGSLPSAQGYFLPICCALGCDGFPGQHHPSLSHYPLTTQKLHEGDPTRVRCFALFCTLLSPFLRNCHTPAL